MLADAILIVVAGLVAVFGLPVLIGALWRQVQLRIIIRSGRRMDWTHVLERLQQGEGLLIENATSHPGKFWWVSAEVVIEYTKGPWIVMEASEDGSIRTEEREWDEDGLFGAMTAKGICVTGVPAGYRHVLRDLDLRGRVRSVETEPFEDRERKAGGAE